MDYTHSNIKILVNEMGKEKQNENSINFVVMLLQLAMPQYLINRSDLTIALKKDMSHHQNQKETSSKSLLEISELSRIKYL